jgi:hypothetical protein
MVVTRCLTCDYDCFNRTPIMKLTNRTDCVFRRLLAPIIGTLRMTRPALICLFAAAIGLNAWAQEGVTPAPVSSAPPRDLQQAQVGGTRVVSPLEAAPSASVESPPLQWGLVDLRPHLNYRLLYGNGIQSSPGQQQNTAINAISPGLFFGIADHWTLDYTPTKTFYSNRAFRDTLDHSLQLNGGTTFEDWVFGLSGSYVSSTQPLIETGMQTKQKTWSTTASVGYHFGSRMLLDTSVSHIDQSAEALTSSREWSTSDWLHYQVAPQWDTAIGFGAGTVNVSAGSDMTYTRPQAQIGWRPTDKLSLNVQGGIEYRKFRSGGAADLRSPTYGASIQYQPVETTALTFGASRTVSPSYFTNQISRGTGWTAGIEQRLFQHFHLGMGLGHQKTSYIATASNVAAGRDDVSNSFNARLSTTILRKVSIAALYQRSRNSSNLAGYTFTSSQVGLEVGWRY